MTFKFLPSLNLTSKLIPLASTALYYLMFNLISLFKFDVVLKQENRPHDGYDKISIVSNILIDFALNLLIAYILFALSRQKWIFLVLQGLIMGVLYIGNAIKISFFGGPIMPDDVFALRSMLLILEGWQFLAAALTIAGIVILLLFNLSTRRWSAFLAALSATALGMVIVKAPAKVIETLDKYTGNSVWDQRTNFLMHGGLLYSFQEGARYFAMAEKPPEAEASNDAAKALLASAPLSSPQEPPANTFVPRNIHIILLESFWDASLLKKAGYNRPPLAAEFLKLWKSAGYSTIMPPVFGGYTANSEFEVLCGFPVNKNTVKFERQLLNETPCLPRILAEKGYRTVVSHPNVPVFWNRVNAYRNMGFQTYWSINDFVKDDMNEEFMSDVSLYRQVMAKLAPTMAKPEPVLDYIVTIFGHWWYPLNASRPPVITSHSKVEEVTTYANTAYYKSLELANFIADLRQRDPDSIIMAFGDHLPFMGGNYAGYADSGVLAPHNSDFTPQMLKFHVTTPAIIIDGNKGPLKFDSLPLYQVPKLLLGLLNHDEPSILDYAHPLPRMRIRPLPGLHFSLSDDGKVDVCKEPPYSKNCRVSAQWLKDAITVSNDLFIGNQYSRVHVAGQNKPITPTITDGAATKPLPAADRKP